MSGPRPIDIIPDVTKVTLEDVNRIITVIDDCSGMAVEVTQPLTTIIQISDAGLQGPQGPPGQVGASEPFSNLSGNIWFTTSSILITGSDAVGQLFLIKNPYTTVSVENSAVQGVVVTSSAENILTLKNNNNQVLFNVSGSGVYQFLTQSNPPTGEVDPGKLWFTSTDFYISLE